MSGWLIGLTAAAMLAAAARCLMSAGAVRQVGSLACAMLLLWAVLKPVRSLTGPLFRDFDLAGQTQNMDTQLKQQSEQLLKSLIEQECETYIVDKAETLGFNCRAEVACRVGEDGLWLPDSVRVMGELTGQQRRELEQAISDELGIAGDRQEYLGGG